MSREAATAVPATAFPSSASLLLEAATVIVCLSTFDKSSEMLLREDMVEYDGSGGFEARCEGRCPVRSMTIGSGGAGRLLLPGGGSGRLLASRFWETALGGVPLGSALEGALRGGALDGGSGDPGFDSGVVGGGFGGPGFDSGIAL